MAQNGFQTKVVIDSTAFEKALIKGAAALGRDFPQVLEEEIDLLMRRIIVLTPPRTKSQGQRRVENDIKFTAVGVHEKLLNIFRDRFGPGPYEGLYSFGKGRTIPIAYARILDTVGQLKGWHHQRQHRTTGRVAKVSGGQSLDNPQKAFVSKGVLAEYIRQEKGNVGAAKGGWAAGQLKVSRGRPLSSWIAKHRLQGYAIKEFKPRLTASQKFVAVNQSPFRKRFIDANRIVKDALKTRARDIARKTEVQLRLRFRQMGLILR